MKDDQELKITCPHCGREIKAASELGKRGGSAKTEAKAAASRENGKKGGRPKKEATK